MRTGYLYHEIFGWHDTGTFTADLPSDPAAGLQPYINYEHADTKRRIHELIVVSGLIESLERIAPRAATMEELTRIHTREHVERIKQESASRLGGDGGDLTTPFGRGGFEIASLAAGGAIEMMLAVADKRIKNGYALIRPPGHHAVRERGMGYCIFANMAIAIAATKARYGDDFRVAVIDWDVHHGNGTESIFLNDPTVLTISLHQDCLYPHDTGGIEVKGAGGSNINIPLPPGTGNQGYVHAMREVVQPALDRFKPDLIAITSGFDSSVFDPLGRMLVTANGYREMTRMLMESAEKLCDGRLMATHEGGYNATYSPFCGLFVMQQLSGITKLNDPFDHADRYPGQELKFHEREIIEKARALVDEIGSAD